MNSNDMRPQPMAHRSIEPANKQVLAYGSEAITALDAHVKRSLQTIAHQQLPVVLFHKKKGAGLAMWHVLRRSPLSGPIRLLEQEDPLFAPVMGLEKRTLEQQEQRNQALRQLAGSVRWGLAVFDPVYIDPYGHLQVSEEVLRITIQLLLRQKQVRFFYRMASGFENAALKEPEQLRQILQAYGRLEWFPMEQVYMTSHPEYDPSLSPGQFLVSLLNRIFSRLLQEETAALEGQSTLIENKLALRSDAAGQDAAPAQQQEMPMFQEMAGYH